MDTNKINELAKILRQNQLTKLDLTEGDTRIVLEAGGREKTVEIPAVYLAPQAGAEPFVSVGTQVKKGDVLCIVESMKMFNNIEAEMDGTIAAVCVDNGQIVEFGQPLVRILPEKEES